ncbi:uncharacterized protein LOC130751565 [Actinidia eriantha]|uniref:uncharacterized protein LOC130751565 n=1 Tax=Actinidia eriantha TaxID=165200 RepID=UPI0025895215|nr:uncharacterized protein LOC130751565 [Actinidia eriantha]
MEGIVISLIVCGSMAATVIIWICLGIRRNQNTGPTFTPPQQDGGMIVMSGGSVGGRDNEKAKSSGREVVVEVGCCWGSGGDGRDGDGDGDGGGCGGGGCGD